ncbi:MAG: hypothetical protein WBG92_05305 [Thiohalocapsa sp.]
MPEDNYSVVFFGELLKKADGDRTRQRLQAWFKLDDAQLTNLLSGRRVVVKRDVDLDTASRYQAAFRKAGAKALIELSTGEAGASLGAHATEHVATTETSTGLTLAPLGALLEELGDQGGPVQSPDISALSLVPGSDWSLADCEPPRPPSPIFDIDGFELVPISEPPHGARQLKRGTAATRALP